MMSAFTRMKRVTDPLDDKAKARIIGRDRIGPDYYVSSGSEHSAHADDDGITSSSLSDFLFGFDADESSLSPPASIDSECDNQRDRSVLDSSYSRLDSIEPIPMPNRRDDDGFQKALAAHVTKAAQIFSCVGSNKQLMRRNVMGYLRNCGYNAAVCKTKWQSCGGLTAGNYEFIDVLRTDQCSTRYLVDLDFAAEFEIARPTLCYERVLRLLPKVFTGTIDDLKKVLSAVSDAAKRSLKSGGLQMPPWRKHRFVQNKWLGPYRRTTNVFPVSFSGSDYGVKCRAVGFDAAAVGGGGLVCPATARTR